MMANPFEGKTPEELKELMEQTAAAVIEARSKSIDEILEKNKEEVERFGQLLTRVGNNPNYHTSVKAILIYFNTGLEKWNTMLEEALDFLDQLVRETTSGN